MQKETLRLLFQHLPASTEENYETPRSGQPVLKPRIEPDTSKVLTATTVNQIAKYPVCLYLVTAGNQNSLLGSIKILRSCPHFLPKMISHPGYQANCLFSNATALK